MKAELTATAPGNLLLAGEYAVLEEGGLGLALAVEPRVTARATGARRLSVEGRAVDRTIRWPAEDESLPAHVIRAIGRNAKELPRLEVVVDSRGVPKGYGSSAATAVALTGVLLAALGDVVSLTEVFSIALAAHRSFQGGRGSGYDVAASTHGGIGLFRGGGSPTWRSVEANWLPEIRLVRGAGPVRTPGAIARYQEWKSRRPEEARSLLSDSNAAVSALAGARSWAQGLEALERARRIGTELGARIGVSAEVEGIGRTGFVKAVGAGAELAVVVGACAGEKVFVSPRGLVVESGRED